MTTTGQKPNEHMHVSSACMSCAGICMHASSYSECLSPDPQPVAGHFSVIEVFEMQKIKSCPPGSSLLCTERSSWRRAALQKDEPAPDPAGQTWTQTRPWTQLHPAVAAPAAVRPAVDPAGRGRGPLQLPPAQRPREEGDAEGDPEHPGPAGPTQTAPAPQAPLVGAALHAGPVPRHVSRRRGRDGAERAGPGQVRGGRAGQLRRAADAQHAHAAAGERGERGRHGDELRQPGGAGAQPAADASVLEGVSLRPDAAAAGRDGDGGRVSHLQDADGRPESEPDAAHLRLRDQTRKQEQGVGAGSAGHAVGSCGPGGLAGLRRHLRLQPLAAPPAQQPGPPPLRGNGGRSHAVGQLDRPGGPQRPALQAALHGDLLQGEPDPVSADSRRPAQSQEEET
ncbi:bone morphogenetic protein 8A isoform X2 [Poecilia reticulata]|uniref:bone morphogenetic protein 8A isoform X2 n=1 Tax=Poecilia reticulata TaxID=8081 RepID=UPI0007EAA815|nr:PREDICTED: bone morphogenetic protein 8A isoform X2 [Poecilia reticulata]